MTRSRRYGLLALTTCVGLFLLAAPAQGAFHLMKIREVYTGTAGQSFEDAFVELQMFAAGQNQVFDHRLEFLDQDGANGDDFGFPSNAPNGDNQRTILVGGDLVPGADFNMDVTTVSNFASVAGAAGGAVCFQDTTTASYIDCVSWGTFSSAPINPHAGTPAAAMGGSQSLTRSIAAGCPTLLEDADDTNNSASDFALAAQTPRGNAATPTESLCLPAAATDGKGPAQTLTAKKVQDVDKATVFARLDEAGTVTLRGKVTIPGGSARVAVELATRKVATKKTSKSLAAGKKTKLKVKFSKSAKAKIKDAIADAGSRKIVVTATARDGLGNKSTKKVRFKLKD